MRATACGSMMVLLCAAAAGAGLLENAGFELVGKAGKPLRWNEVSSFGPCELTTEAPRSGEYAGRVAGEGRQRAWRQPLPNPGQGIFSASGWFRTQDARVDGSQEGFARFYFHILYKDQPYSATTHLYVDVPPGTYPWRRFALRLVPRADLEVREVWCTVAAKLASGTLDFDDLSVVPAEPRGGALALEWSRARDAVTLWDMGLAQPRDALSPRAKHGHWQLFPYELHGARGRMVWASALAGAPELTLPLGVRGWHAVYLGMASPSGVARVVRARLTRDPAFVRRRLTRGQLEEVLLKVADLTGQSLHVAQQSAGRATACGLAYVKLVPLTQEEAAAVQAERADASLRRLVTSIDGFSFFHSRKPTTRAALLEEVEAYRHSDFGALMLQMGGADMVNYPSAIGEMIGQDLDDFPRPGDRDYSEALRELAAKGINPTKVLIEGAHDVGMKVYVCIRPGAWVHTEPMSDFFRSRFYLAHPEWRCVDRDGTPVARMSFAVPQVRAHLLAVLREAVRLGADGAGVIFVRGAPYVLYEEPFCAAFKDKHGVDPKTLSEDDPRIVQMRCELLTTFMRELRQMLDQEGQRRGRGERLRAGAFVFANEADNRRFGLDLRGWAQEGLVDLLCPFARVGGSRARTYDMAFLRDACQRHDVAVHPTFISWRLPSLDALMRQAVGLYEQGADGLTFWDANSVADSGPRWSVVSRMGHRSELAERAEEGEPQPTNARFHRLGDLVVDGPYNPNWGY